MRKIHQLFLEPGASRISEMTRNSQHNICWYPSAGADLRHISFLEREWFKSPSENRQYLYVHTDVSLPTRENRNNDRHNPIYFDIGLELPHGLTVEEVSEVEFKKPPREKSDDVLLFSTSYEHMGRCFFVILRFETIHHCRIVSWEVPLLYAIAENLSFLVRVLLLYQLQVHTLVHIRDGGASLGGSDIPMNFIYLVADKLRLQRVHCDLDPPSRFSFMYECAQALENEIRHAKYEIKFRKDVDASPPNVRTCLDFLNEDYSMRLHMDQLKQKLAEAWNSKEISITDFPANWANPPDGHYHDWKRVPNNGGKARRIP